MGLDWLIHQNGKYVEEGKESKIHCNGMELDPYLDGTTAHMVADLGLCPFYPLWPAGMGPEVGNHPANPEINAQDMVIVAKQIAKKATEAEHLRIAAWLWTWANCNEDDCKITLHLSY